MSWEKAKLFGRTFEERIEAGVRYHEITRPEAVLLTQALFLQQLYDSFGVEGATDFCRRMLDDIGEHMREIEVAKVGARARRH